MANGHDEKLRESIEKSINIYRAMIFIASTMRVVSTLTVVTRASSPITPGLEQILERFANNGFAAAATGPLDDVELLEVVIDEELNHGVPDVVCAF